MKNLMLMKLFKNTMDCSLHPELCCFSDECFYFVSNLNVYVSDYSHFRVVSTLNHLHESNRPVYLDFAFLNSKLVVCMSKGEIVTCDIATGETELVGCVEPGILAARWSPGENQMALVTSSYSLVFLGQDLDPMHECELQGSASELLVSVGWGKSETQFRGSAGKYKETNRDIVKTHDDGKVRLSWRGDGELVVVSFPLHEGRQIKVANNEGHLLYHVESIPGLESSLCWKPSGSLIASTLQMPNKRIVSFFEKNLLRHGGFELADNCVVDEIIWNNESTILAIIINNHTSVKLFCTSNYHWYHKFTIDIPSDESAVCVAWEKEDANTIVIFTSNGSSLIKYGWTWRWCMNVSNGTSVDDQSWAAVIDGQKLLLTAFRRGIVPPPMSSLVVHVDELINAVGFLQCSSNNSITSSNDFFIQTVSNKIIIYRYSAKDNTHTQNLCFRLAPNTLQVSWVAPDVIMACGISSLGKYYLVVYRLETKTMVERRLIEPFTAARRFRNEEKVLLWQGKNNTIVDMEGNDLYKENSCMTSMLLTLEIQGKTIFALDSANCLMISELPLAKNITSVYVTSTHLLAITMQHKLNCWRLDSLTVEPSVRLVERGAQIVTHISGTSGVVLQMPRGNLEVVQPRSLTMYKLKELLDALEFYKAFLIMRRERINLNLLYDHNPSNFERNVSHFVKDIGDPTYLCNFIAEVSNDNVTRTLYSSFYVSQSDDESKKVDLVCTLLLGKLTQPSLLLPRLSCLVRKGQLENALKLIKSIRDSENALDASAVSSSEGLAHILYLVDIEELVKIALGTYDLPLVMFIASKSQKDPKEYVPFLANLQKMESCYQKFTIDDYLKRYKNALHHLSLCPSRVKECLDYVVKHGLYRDGLKAFAPGTDTWKSVSVLYGADLTRQGKHEEAGIVLERAGEMILAEHAFGRAGCWKRQLSCAQMYTIAEDQKDLLSKSIAEMLRTGRRYKELAQFCFDHCGDTAGGVDALVNAQDFDEAIRQAHLRGLTELVDSKIRPAAVQTAIEIKETIDGIIKELTSSLSRLETIKRDITDNNLVMDFDDSDTASESSRGSSRLSSRSAKNTRKLKRNLMKKGGRFENVALIASLHDIATRVVSFKTKVRSLNATLLLLDEELVAHDLQISLKSSLDSVQMMVENVWQPVMLDQPTTSNSAAMAFTCVQRQLPEPVRALQPKVLFPPDLCNGVQWQLDVLQ